MELICKKCQFVNTDPNATKDDPCPKCGAIYSKVEQGLASNLARPVNRASVTFSGQHEKKQELQKEPKVDDPKIRNVLVFSAVIFPSLGCILVLIGAHLLGAAWILVGIVALPKVQDLEIVRARVDFSRQTWLGLVWGAFVGANVLVVGAVQGGQAYASWQKQRAVEAQQKILADDLSSRRQEIVAGISSEIDQGQLAAASTELERYKFLSDLDLKNLERKLDVAKKTSALKERIGQTTDPDQLGTIYADLSRMHPEDASYRDRADLYSNLSAQKKVQAAAEKALEHDKFDARLECKSKAMDQAKYDGATSDWSGDVQTILLDDDHIQVVGRNLHFKNGFGVSVRVTYTGTYNRISKRCAITDIQ